MRHAPVSVIIPCYNSAETIGRALESVFVQTWPPAEIVLIDDASTDGGKTLAALRSLESQQEGGPRVHVIALERNGGPASARNKGWEVATQPFVAFLDSDDAWHPEKLEWHVSWMQRHPDCVLSGHRYAQKSDAQDPWPQVPGDIVHTDLRPLCALLSNPLSTPTVIILRDLPYRFMEGKRASEDYLLWLQVMLSGACAVRLEVSLAATFKPNYGASGLSARLWAMENGELGTYWSLHEGGSLGSLHTAALSAWSVAKYLKRALGQIVRRDS